MFEVAPSGIDLSSWERWLSPLLPEPCGVPCSVFPSSGVLETRCLLTEAVQSGAGSGRPLGFCPGHADGSGAHSAGCSEIAGRFPVASSNSLCAHSRLGQSPASHRARDTGPLPAAGHHEEKSCPSGWAQGAVEGAHVPVRPEDRTPHTAVLCPHPTPQGPGVLPRFLLLTFSLFLRVLCVCMSVSVYLCGCVRVYL